MYFTMYRCLLVSLHLYFYLVIRRRSRKLGDPRRRGIDGERVPEREEPKLLLKGIYKIYINCNHIKY